MSNSLMNKTWLSLFSASALTLSLWAQAQTREAKVLVIPRAASLQGLAASTQTMTSLSDELQDIQDLVKDGKRRELVDVIAETEDEIKAQRISKEDDVTVKGLRLQKNVLSTLSSNTPKVLGDVQVALVTASENTDVKSLVQGGRKDPVVVEEKLPSSIFDVKVTYTREGEGDEATLKRQVELVPKSDSELLQSQDQGIRALAQDAVKDAAKNTELKPLLKEAVEAAVQQISEPVSSYLSESDVKITDGMQSAPVEGDLKNNQDNLAASVSESEKEVSDELKRAEQKRDIAKEDTEAEVQRLRAKQEFAEWAKDNAEEAKKLDECGMAKKVMDLNQDLSFDMLDVDIKEKCKDLQKSDMARNERRVLSDIENDGRTPATSNSEKKPSDLTQEQQRQAAIQQFMQTVQACMQSNMAATNSIDKIKEMIQPAYNAISGFDQLEAALKSSSVAQNVLARMLSEGLDGETAASDMMSEIQQIYSNTDSGNTELHAEVKKLFRLKGKLGFFVDEYNKRSEQMARSVGDMEARKLNDLLTRAQAGDQGAQMEMNLRGQQNLPTNPADAYKVAYDSQMMERQRDPNHMQQMRYLDAVSAASGQLSSLYSQRESQMRANNNQWIGSNAVVNSARQTLNSPQLRSNPNISVGQAFSTQSLGSRVPASRGAGVGPGNLRSTGVPAPGASTSQPVIRQVPQGGSSRSNAFR